LSSTAADEQSDEALVGCDVLGWTGAMVLGECVGSEVVGVVKDVWAGCGVLVTSVFWTPGARMLDAAVGCEVVVALQSRAKYKLQTEDGVMMLSVHEVDIEQSPLLGLSSKEMHVESARQS
jgi:hypothetical protein